MGALMYNGQPIQFDDPLLAHLQIVIVQKLGRKESFLMSWLNVVSVGDGRDSIWLDSTLPLRFHFLGSKSPTIDRNWLELLATSAAGSTGLIVRNANGTLARCNSVSGFGR
jgi:hypothetical protein